MGKLLLKTEPSGVKVKMVLSLTLLGIRESAGSQLAGREMLRGAVGNASVYRHPVGGGVLSKIKERISPGQDNFGG